MNKNQLLKDYIDKIQSDSNLTQKLLEHALYDYVKRNNIDYATLAIALCAHNPEERQKAFEFWDIQNENVNFDEIRELFSDYTSDKWECLICDKAANPEEEPWIVFEESTGIYTVRIIDGKNHIYIDGGDAYLIEDFDEEFKDANDLGRFLNWIR